MGTGIACSKRPTREFPLEALQFLVELGVGLDDTLALRRVADGLRAGVPRCCIAFTLIYGRVVDAGRPDLVAGYRSWMNRSGAGRLGDIPCPRCPVEASRRGALAAPAAEA